MTQPSQRQRHSLWLMPEGVTRRRLTGILHELSRRYRGPEFLPHVTLLGSLQIDRDILIKKSRRVAAALHPFTIKLKNVGMTRQYFRDLFVHAGPHETLHEAHWRASRILAVPADSAFMPHLSLLYGAHSERLKERIAGEMRLPAQFRVRNLYLFETQGPVRSWHEVARFPLSRVGGKPNYREQTNAGSSRTHQGEARLHRGL